jgi:hypothetical protein
MGAFYQTFCWEREIYAYCLAIHSQGGELMRTKLIKIDVWLLEPF